MRREWSGWIKNRQWHEFEQLAKTDPSQPLADIVAELERGFTDKPDRRALRKVLFLLGRSGYHPNPIEDLSTAELGITASPSEPHRFGFLSSADAAGGSLIAYAREDGGKLRWLYLLENARQGIYRANEDEQPLSEGLMIAKKYPSSHRDPYLLRAEISPDYALWRISEACSRTRGPIPTAIAMWKGEISRSQEIAHPAENYDRSSEVEHIGGIPFADGPPMTWRLELGSVAPVFQEPVDPGTDDETRKAQFNEAMERICGTIFSNEIVADHIHRLLDLAYIYRVSGREGSDVLMAAVDDLRSRGANSDYAMAIFRKTVLILMEELKASEKQKHADV